MNQTYFKTWHNNVCVYSVHRGASRILLNSVCYTHWLGLDFFLVQTSWRRLITAIDLFKIENEHSSLLSCVRSLMPIHENEWLMDEIKMRSKRQTAQLFICTAYGIPAHFLFSFLLVILHAHCEPSCNAWKFPGGFSFCSKIRKSHSQWR